MRFAILILSIFACSCTTLYVHNGPDASQRTELNEWHHDGILRLVEFSSPVDLNDRCEGKDWDSIKVEKTFIQGLVSLVTYGIYDPWDVNLQCKKPEIAPPKPKKS